MKLKRAKLLACIAPALIVSAAFAQTAAETEDRGRFYEDDAWYDVSEWFDGNDYNPTDEAIGRWDNETFQYAEAQQSDDSDNDRNADAVSSEEFYGTDYDDGYVSFWDRDGRSGYEATSRYFDTDNDKLYDSHATYHDRDGDGTYEEYEFTALSSVPENAIRSNKIAQSAQKGLSGKAQDISGKVAETKYVERLGKVALLAHVQSDNGKKMWIDLGNDGLTLQVYKGDQLTATGPISKRGNKQVLLATSIEVDGKQVNIERTGRKYTGTIESTKTAKVRGNERLVVKMKTDGGKMLTVDMGNPADAKDIKKGQEVTVTGVPIKVGDRVMLVADTQKNQS